MPSPRRLAAIALAGALAASPALAHHGWADYQPGETTISGVVQAASLGNPHGVLRVRDADGRVWAVMLAPPAAIARSGLTTPLVPVGAQVSAEGQRHADPLRLEIKTERLTVGARTFDLYPARE
jgi:hypothetical protein